MLLQVRNLTKHFAGLAAVNDVSFDVREGEILAIVGPNGAGKSVLFGLISGHAPPDLGQVLLAGRRDYRLEAAPDRPPGNRPHLSDHGPVSTSCGSWTTWPSVIGCARGGFLVARFCTPVAGTEDKAETTARVMETLQLHRAGGQGLSLCLHPFPGRAEAPVHRGRPDQPTQDDPAG